MTLSRRSLLAVVAAKGFAKATPFRYAVCNETFEGKTFIEGCRLAKQTGYSGLEIAPAMLGADPAGISKQQRREYAAIMRNEGLHYAGLHSLMPARPGLHLTTSDTGVRTRSWEFFRQLVDLAADLGSEPVMVLGSGKQRAAIAGDTAADARKRLRNGLAALAAHAGERRVRILLEPLSPQFTNVVNTLQQAVALVKEIGSEWVQSMFDTHNTVAEALPHDRLIREYAAYIRHVHVNEMDGRHPGTGRYDFELVMRALSDTGYGGWISLEVFSFQPSGEEVARQARAHLRGIEDRLGGGKR